MGYRFAPHFPTYSCFSSLWVFWYVDYVACLVTALMGGLGHHARCQLGKAKLLGLSPVVWRLLWGVRRVELSMLYLVQGLAHSSSSQMAREPLSTEGYPWGTPKPAIPWYTCSRQAGEMGWLSANRPNYGSCPMLCHCSCNHTWYSLWIFSCQISVII